MPPLIGVSSNFGVDPDTKPPREQTYVLADYTDAVTAAGGIPVCLPVLREFDDHAIDAVLSKVDGLMLTGGFDLNPQHYGAAKHPTTTIMHARRDAFEMALFRRADELRIPTFGICLGFQVAHVSRGGRLHQHIDELDLPQKITHHLPQDENAFHRVSIAPDSKLAEILGTTELEINSRHHQIIDPAHLGRDLQTVAQAPDGVIEASEDCANRFLLLVQWHPEAIHDRAEQLHLFQALVVAAQH
jgi:putative glutamine amidotransferase